MSLRDSLQLKDSNLYNRFCVIEKQAENLLEYSQAGAHMSFTPHGLSHISALEDIYEWLLTIETLEEMSSLELFLLLCATFFHDSMMIPKQLGDEAITRRDHAKKAGSFLQKNRDLIGLNIHEAEAIGEIIKGHGVDSLEDIDENCILGSEVIDLRKLASILSLADICHADSSRAPEIVFRYLDLDEESSRHWRRHMQISGVTRQNSDILIGAISFSDDGEAAIKAYAEEIQSELSRIKPYFSATLTRIDNVETRIKTRESELDVTIKFRANAPAILSMLIEGVYKRDDVFIRELVQNSLDACHLKTAKAIRRCEPYTPRILVTAFYHRDNLIAVRVDDNGLGMDINDIQDTVLWIGSSWANKEVINNLLNATTKKKLIASFGIGLLSCFKSGEKITVRSAKENRPPIGFSVNNVNDAIQPKPSSDNFTGSTFIVEFSKETDLKQDVGEIIGHYFKNIHQAELRYLELVGGKNVSDYNREELFQISITESIKIKPCHLPDSESVFLLTKMSSDNFNMALWFNYQKANDDEDFNIDIDEGSITILNEGIFVATDKTTEWLPRHFSMLSGVIDFGAKAVNLPVSRDSVAQDNTKDKILSIIASKCNVMIESLCEFTHMGKDSWKAAIILSYIFMLTSKSNRRRILAYLDNYCVMTDTEERKTTLREISSHHNETIYVAYNKGKWVEYLTVFHGNKLYHNSNDLISLQATLLRQRGDLVINATRADIKYTVIKEASLINAYFEERDLDVIDLTTRDVISGSLRSKPIPYAVRQEISSRVKFVDIASIPNQRCWRVGNEIWVNVANHDMKLVYESLQVGNLDDYRVVISVALLDMASFNLEDSFDRLIDQLA